MKEIAVVFPGQGSQRVGMAKDFFDNCQECREVFEMASDVLHFDMQELCFTENEKLKQTEYTQTAILTAEIAIFESLKKRFELTATYYAGHSLGEYTALVASGVVPFSTALKIVQGRGSLMQDASPIGKGTMAALVLENIGSTDYLRIVHESGAEVANLNSTSQIVISGSFEAISTASASLKSALPEITIVPLQVTAPFHSSLMQGIEKTFTEFLGGFTSHFDLSRATSVLSNYTGVFHAQDTLVEMLVKQISGPVQWLKNMEALAAVQLPIFEIAPMPVLRRFFSSVGVEVNSIIDLRSCKRALGAFA